MTSLPPSLPTRLTAERLVEIAARDAVFKECINGWFIDELVADRRALLAHVTSLEADLAACRRDQARYRVVREFVQPRYLSDGLGIKWDDIPNDQTIAEKIDELCDAALSAQAGTGER